MKGVLKMNIDIIIQLINGVGFPIAVSVALFWTNSKQDERYSNVMKELTQVINNNTKTLAELCTKIDTIDGGVKND